MPRNGEEILTEAFHRREYRYLDDEQDFNDHLDDETTNEEDENNHNEEGDDENSNNSNEEEDSRVLGQLHPKSPLLLANKTQSNSPQPLLCNNNNNNNTDVNNTGVSNNDMTSIQFIALSNVTEEQLSSGHHIVNQSEQPNAPINGHTNTNELHPTIPVSMGRLSLALADNLADTYIDSYSGQISTISNARKRQSLDLSNQTDKTQPIDMPTHLRDQTLSDGRSQLSRSLSPSLLMSATNNNNNNNDDDVSSSNRMNEMATVLLSDDDEEACHLKQGKQIARSKSIHRRSASYGNPLQISTNIASTLHNMASVDDTTDTATPTTPTTPTTPLKTKKPMDSKTMAKMKRKSIEFSNNLTCVICCDYYQQPVRLRRCRHLFCRPCILASLARTSTCPICRTKTRQRDLVPSVRTGKLVDALQVRCDYAPRCRWIGQRIALDQHLSVDCREVLVPCSADPLHPDCADKYPRRKINAHRRICRWRMTPCAFGCGELFYDTRALTLHCQQQCLNRTVNCLHCDAQHLARHRDRHLLTCPRAIIPCPHQAALGTAAGCMVRVERRDLPLHLRQCRFEDMKDVLRGVRIHLNTLTRRQRASELRYKAELRRITTLTLHSSDLRDTFHLRNLLRFNPAIRALHIRDFQPGPAWVQLTEVLQDNAWPIHTLNLHGSTIEKTGAVLLAKALRTNQRTRHLILTDNVIGDQGVEFLMKALMEGSQPNHLNTTSINMNGSANTATTSTNTPTVNNSNNSNNNNHNSNSNSTGYSALRHWPFQRPQTTLRDTATVNGRQPNQHYRRTSAPAESTLPNNGLSNTLGSSPSTSLGSSIGYHTMPTQLVALSLGNTTSNQHGRSNRSTRPTPVWLAQQGQSTISNGISTASTATNTSAAATTATATGTSATANNNSSNNNHGTAQPWPTLLGQPASLPTYLYHPRNRLTTLLLSGCLLTDKSAELLARGLSTLPRLHTLDLSWNRFRHRGAEQIGYALSTHPSLRRFNFSANDLGPKGSEALAGMIGRNAILRELDLSRNKLGGAKGLEALSRALSPSLLRASRGEVAAFNIGPSSMMSHGPRKSIDHSTNYQQQNMANTANYTNQQPSIPNSRLKTTSTTNATNIRQRATSSPSLNLNDLFMPPTNDTTTNANNNNNSSSSSSNNNNNNNMASVYSPLPRRTSSGGAVTSIGGGASMHLPTNTTLRILRLNDNAIDDTGALHLSRALLKHPGLRRIDLADNRISDMGITELLDAIYESGRPRTLHIRGNSSVSRELQYEVSGLAREAAIYADQLGEPMTDDESSPSTDNTDSDNDGDGDGGNEGNSSWLDEYELGDELDNLALPVYHSRNDRNGHTSKKEMSTLFKR